MKLATAKAIVKRLNKNDEEGQRPTASLYENYSGRGMFGATTAGVVLPGWAITGQMKSKYRSDNLGLDMIIY